MRSMLITVALAGVFLVSPMVLLAQSSTSTGLVPCTGPDCTTDDAIQLANNIITFLISMLGVIAVIALVITGFQMVVSAGNEGAWKEAKKRFTNIIIGIIIILAAFLIVDTILKALTDKGLEDTTKGLVDM